MDDPYVFGPLVGASVERVVPIELGERFIGLRWAMALFAAVLAFVLIAVSLFNPAYVRPLRHLGASRSPIAVQ